MLRTASTITENTTATIKFYQWRLGIITQRSFYRSRTEFLGARHEFLPDYLLSAARPCPLSPGPLLPAPLHCRREHHSGAAPRFLPAGHRAAAQPHGQRHAFWIPSPRLICLD